MNDLSDVICILPTMKSGNELLSALEVLPEYAAAICDAGAPVRLMALSDLYRVYVPKQRILSALIEQDLVDETTLMLDSTIVKVHQHTSGVKKGIPRRNRTEQGRFDNESPCGNGCAWKSIAFFALRRKSQ